MIGEYGLTVTLLLPQIRLFLFIYLHCLWGQSSLPPRPDQSFPIPFYLRGEMRTHAALLRGDSAVLWESNPVV